MNLVLEQAVDPLPIKELPHYTLGCCVWQRHALTDIIYAYYARVRAEVADVVKLDLIAIGSEGRQGEAERHGWAYAERPNQPLGAKHNALAEHVGETGSRGLIVIGSDDLISAAWVRQCVKDLETGADIVGLIGFAFFDLHTGSLEVYSSPRKGREPPMLMGAGRGMSRRALETCNWKPWPEQIMKTLDRESYWNITKRLPKACIVRHPFGFMEELVGVGIKGGGTNIWSYKKIAKEKQLPPLPAGWIEEHFGSDVVRELSALRLSLPPPPLRRRRPKPSSRARAQARALAHARAYENRR